MEYNRAHLEGLLEMVKKICADGDNAWFREELRQYLGFVYTANSNLINPEMVALLNDVRRTRSYLEKIDKTFYHEGFRFYQEIVDPNLKIELANDYKIMKIAELEKDLVEYARRIVMQLENIFNFVIGSLPTWDIIAQNPETYKRVNSKNPNNSIDLIFGNGKDKYCFFCSKPTYDNGTFLIDRKVLYKRNINEIEFPPKKEFLIFYYNCYFDSYKFGDMNFLRNKASHRGRSSDDTRRINALKANWYENSYEYFFMLQSNLDKIKVLFQKK